MLIMILVTILFDYDLMHVNRFTGYIYNLGHNILELYNVLMHTRLTTSKKKRDI